MTTSEPRLPDDFSDVEELPHSSGRLRVAIEITVAILILVGIYYLFAPEQEIELPPLQRQEIDPIIREQIDAARRQPTAPDQAMNGERPTVTEQTTSSEKPTPGNATPGTGEQMAQSASEQAVLPDGAAARKLIDNLRSGEVKLSQRGILQQARTYQQSGDLTDAYLLLFFAARQGDGQAAFDLATLQDPNYFQTGNSLLETPDAFQAHKWYSKAAAQHVAQAKERLQALHNTIRKQADDGDMAARRLLLNWQ
jgi:hypothetical protein